MGMKWIEDEKRFINPYQFVPLGQGVNRTVHSDVTEANTVSGRIHCKLYVKTPLAIPDSEQMTATCFPEQTALKAARKATSVLP